MTGLSQNIFLIKELTDTDLILDNLSSLQLVSNLARMSFGKIPKLLLVIILLIFRDTCKKHNYGIYPSCDIMKLSFYVGESIPQFV